MSNFSKLEVRGRARFELGASKSTDDALAINLHDLAHLFGGNNFALLDQVPKIRQD